MGKSTDCSSALLKVLSTFLFEYFGSWSNEGFSEACLRWQQLLHLYKWLPDLHVLAVLLPKTHAWSPAIFTYMPPLNRKFSVSAFGGVYV